MLLNQIKITDTGIYVFDTFSYKVKMYNFIYVLQFMMNSFQDSYNHVRTNIAYPVTVLKIN